MRNSYVAAKSVNLLYLTNCRTTDCIIFKATLKYAWSGSEVVETDRCVIAELAISEDIGGF